MCRPGMPVQVPRCSFVFSQVVSDRLLTGLQEDNSFLASHFMSVRVLPIGVKGFYMTVWDYSSWRAPLLADSMGRWGTPWDLGAGRGSACGSNNFLNMITDV